jgi:hypothetical protein
VLEFFQHSTKLGTHLHEQGQLAKRVHKSPNSYNFCDAHFFFAFFLGGLGLFNFAMSSLAAALPADPRKTPLFLPVTALVTFQPL